jgi:tetratricopeptide (TPR) repeat protein
MKKALFLLFAMLISLQVWGASTPRLVLVFPLENLSPRPGVGWLSEGIAEILSTRLESSMTYVLRREERSAAYTQMGFPPGSPLTLASEYVVAETLGVQQAVVGDFSVTGDKLTTRVRVLDVRRLKLSPWFDASGDLADLVGQETGLVWRLLAFSDPHFITGDEQEFARRFAPIRLDAFENYIRGVLSRDDSSRVRFLERADNLDPADHRAAFQLGRYYFGQKDYAQSAKWLTKLDKKDDSYSDAQFLLGVDEFYLGDNDDAWKAFDALAMRAPLDQVLNNRGVIEARQGHYEEASSDFERALRADPKDSDYGFNLAVCLWYEKKYDRMIQLLREELKRRGDDADAHSLLAASLGEVGDAPGRKREMAWLAGHGDAPGSDASADFASLTRIKKTYDGRAFHLLSLAIQNAEESELTREPVPQQGRARLERGRELLAQGQLPEAESELVEATALLPSSSEAHLLLGRVYETEGKHQAAASQLEESLNYHDSFQAHLWLARAYLALRRPQAALDQTQAALRLDPVNRETESLIREIKDGSRESSKVQ